MECRRIEFMGVAAYELTTDLVKMVIVEQFGPRIAFFGFVGDDNILLWEPGKYTRGEWDLRGGHRVWAAGMGADENESTYAPDNCVCRVQFVGDAIRITGAKCPLTNTERGIQVRALTSGIFEVQNFVTNVGDMLYAGGIWALTCTVPSMDCVYAIPIGDTSPWNTTTMVLFDRWAGHGHAGFSDPQVKVTNTYVHVTPAGLETKRMVQSRLGIIAMVDRGAGFTFVKRAKYNPAGQYPGGCNTAFYVGPANFMVEMETMGPQSVMRTDETVVLTEQWALTPDVSEAFYQNYAGPHTNVTDIFAGLPD